MSGVRSKMKIKEGVVLVIDVGEAVGNLVGNGKSFLENSKICASRIIQRKIFANSQDEFGLVLIGSEETKNELNYPNVYVQNSYFSCANWNLMKNISNLTVAKHSGNSSNSDWLDGLIVAVNLLKEESECKSFSTKKIVLMSNFATPVTSIDNVDDTIKALKDLEIGLVVIGPELEDGSSENEVKSPAQRKNEAIISRIVEETDGVTCGFDEAMVPLGRYQKIQTRAMPWNCDLQIGSNIFVPIVGYKKFDSKKLLIWKKRSREKSAIVEERVHFEGDQQVDKADVIKSYTYGQTIVPFSEDDKAATSLQTEKCFQVIMFAKKEEVPIHMLMGESVLYIAPRTGNEGAVSAMVALAQVLLEQQQVAIVRKVYRKNTAPLIGALIPTCETSNNRKCYFFYWVKLPFAEDDRRLKLPSLRHIKPTQEQQDVVKKLIDSMDLSQLDEEEDPYRKPVNPLVEHVNDLITFKALNPSSEMPTQPSERVKNMLKPLPDILANASQALDEIKRLFPLEEVEQKTYRRAAADIFNRSTNNNPANVVAPQDMVNSVTSLVQSTVTEVGTIDPEGNFLKLLDQGASFGSVCEQMKTAIKKLIFTSSSSVGAEKAISAMKLLRERCVSRNPVSYNTFVASLKDDLVERGNTDLWDVIVQEKLGLITSVESQQSNVSADEAVVFYEIKKCESQSEEQCEMEVEDLLAEL
ncbi:X-ray repair cross-complementing protein 5-like isoform X2 [Macrosteles quadrilineatus]|uniref:X-ray repair cross-complementing protein 5-like isoform X2 n=1 Tax=Macrosteles quadrilineatus TaxID=74068 RepID=UPI0023E1230C|nr:X-ray repair cross-complementing protein 5-like isoform X2 [Macrosteles quadrilineatus]